MGKEGRKVNGGRRKGIGKGRRRRIGKGGVKKSGGKKRFFSNLVINNCIKHENLVKDVYVLRQRKNEKTICKN